MRAALARAERCAELVGGALIAAILVAVFVGVVRRYLFGAPIVWIDELVSALFLWAVFWTAAFVVPLREHVAFEMIDEALPASARRAIGVAGALAAAIALALAAPKIIDFIAFLWRERTPALQWRLDLVYTCFGLFVVAIAVRLAHRAWSLLGRGWRDRLSGSE